MSNKQGLSRESSSCSHSTLGCKLILTREHLCPFALIEPHQEIAEVLQCPISSFPCTYLGLPLSTPKMTHGMLMLVIHRVDKRKSSASGGHCWGGRLILINSVLAVIPNHFMECFLWPKESLQKLEQILRGFLWQGKSSASGGHCLVAWDFVKLPKANGGLGIRDPAAHNVSMICKFASKILQHSDEPCYNWFASLYCHHTIPVDNQNGDTAIWKCLKTSFRLVWVNHV